MISNTSLETFRCFQHVLREVRKNRRLLSVFLFIAKDPDYDSLLIVEWKKKNSNPFLRFSRHIP
jgi:hypothetical protein